MGIPDGHHMKRTCSDLHQFLEVYEPGHHFPHTTTRVDPKVELVMLGPGLSAQRISTAEQPINAVTRTLFRCMAIVIVVHDMLDL